MIVTDGEKVMTLEELALKICREISGEDAEGCYYGKCPAEEYCRYGHNGMIDLLRKVVSGE